MVGVGISSSFFCHDFCCWNCFSKRSNFNFVFASQHFHNFFAWQRLVLGKCCRHCGNFALCCVVFFKQSLWRSDHVFCFLNPYISFESFHLAEKLSKKLFGCESEQNNFLAGMDVFVFGHRCFKRGDILSFGIFWHVVFACFNLFNRNGIAGKIYAGATK